jgi:hypothetical protein
MRRTFEVKILVVTAPCSPRSACLPLRASCALPSRSVRPAEKARASCPRAFGIARERLRGARRSLAREHQRRGAIAVPCSGSPFDLKDDGRHPPRSCLRASSHGTSTADPSRTDSFHAWIQLVIIHVELVAVVRLGQRAPELMHELRSSIGSSAASATAAGTWCTRRIRAPSQTRTVTSAPCARSMVFRTRGRFGSRRAQLPLNGNRSCHGRFRA